MSSSKNKADSDIDVHEYIQPLWMKPSRTVSSIVVAIMVALYLPGSISNPFLDFIVGVFICTSVISFVQDLHVHFVELPHFTDWNIDHIKKYHMDDIDIRELDD